MSSLCALEEQGDLNQQGLNLTTPDKDVCVKITTSERVLQGGWYKSLQQNTILFGRLPKGECGSLPLSAALAGPEGRATTLVA